MVDEDFAVAGEVVLFESGGGESGFGVEEAGELGDEGFTLWGGYQVRLWVLMGELMGR